MPPRKILAAICLAACVSCAFAKVDQQQIAECYKRGVQGDAQAVERCIELLEAAVKDQPSNALAQVYLGSAYTLRSRDMRFGPAKLATLNRGLAMMDSAVVAAPGDPRVRLVRASTTDALPFFLGRKKSARDDFAFLNELAQRHPEEFSKDDLATVRAHATR